jgi:ubiquinone/menaquinone biosynthesis C-methylase UbiE
MPFFSDLSLNLSAWLRKRRLSKVMPVLIEMLSPKKDDIILDVGAGTGIIAEEMAKLCDEVFALEPDPKRVEYIKRKYPQVKAFDGAAEAIQFPEAYFTKIYSVSSFHHFKDKENALYELHRVLKRNGILVIRDYEPQARTSRVESRAADVHFLGADEVKQKLEDTGFEIKEVRKQSGFYLISSIKP